MQLEILGCLVLNGPQTKGMVEKILKKRHGDVLYSVDNLEAKGLVHKHKHFIAARGRRQHPYEITDTGLRVLIDENQGNVFNFWKILIGYCHHHQSTTVDNKKIQDYIDLFKKRYLKYKYKGYRNQLNIFDEVLKNWINNNVKNKSEISNEQKILEILALKRRLTFNQLVDATQSSDSEITRILSIYTLQNYMPPKRDVLSHVSSNVPISIIPQDINQLVDATQSSDSEITNSSFDSIIQNLNLQRCIMFRFISLGDTSFPLSPEIRVDSPPHISDMLKNEYQDFMLHCFIHSWYDETKNENLYELSLFGLIAVLFLIRQNDMMNLKHGLFNKDISFSDYFNKIVNTYQDKLPLIFGKWNILKDVLRLFSIYNFDIILDSDVRQNQINGDSASITRGGNKELVEGIKTIVSQNRNQLAYFAKLGERILNYYILGWSQGYYNDESNNGKGNSYLSNNDIFKDNAFTTDKAEIIREILSKELVALYPLEYTFSRYQIKEDIDMPSLLKYLDENVVKVQEKMFEWEITSLYYFNLYFNTETDARFSHPMIYYSAFEDKKKVYPLQEPKDCLKHISELDKPHHHQQQQLTIKEWFLDVMDDLHMLAADIEKSFALFPKQ